MNTTSGVAPPNDHWQQAKPIPSLPFSETVDTAFADGEDLRLFDLEKCFVSAVDPRLLGTVWWKYTPKTTGPMPALSADLHTPWDSDLGRAPLATAALLTADGPVAIPRQNPDDWDCESPVMLRAGQTYLIAVAVYDDSYYDNTLINGGPVTLRVGNMPTPGIPSRASQTVSTTTRLATVKWSPPASPGSTPITGYRVVQELRTHAGRWTTVSRSELPATARSWTSKRLSPSHAYRTRVSAVNRRGASSSVDLIAWAAR